MKKAVTRDNLGTKNEGLRSTPGTRSDILAVLLRPATGQTADGVVQDGPHSFRVVRVTDRRLIEAKMAISRDLWTKAVAIFQMRKAYEDRDELAARNAVAKLHGLNPQHFSSRIRYDESAAIWAGAEFTRRMAQARFVMWLNVARHTERESLEPGLLCPDVETALFVRAALRDLRACPSCDALFAPERADQTYCTIRCRETHRKRRQRMRHARKRGGK